MSNKVVARQTFQKQAKRLARRYKSFPHDLQILVDELKENASLGTPLGGNVYKIRLAITSKNKGKSGGARIIIYVYLQADTLYLLSIYDKADTENITDDELKYLIKEVEEDFK
ncbi:MAG: type II toxin-antitoxin system RelE/ParE family toxin [Acidobacteriota bacterium]|nr:type II toxin-antitoxin system RelE/ParE family toxin [Acidobacteriota bacterium]